MLVDCRVLCETVKSFVDKVAPGEDDENEETIDGKVSHYYIILLLSYCITL